MSAARAAAARKRAKGSSTFESVDIAAVTDTPPPGMTRAYTNNRYTVMIYDDAPTTHGPAIKVLIQRHDAKKISSWRALQRIKTALFGADTWAVEYYPSEDRVIDDHHIYWLFIYPPGVLPIPVKRALS